MRLALAQPNPTVGDTDGNVALALEAIDVARAAGADALLLPELFLSGYPPRDLLLQEGYLDELRAGAERVAAAATRLVVFLGTPWANDEADPGAGIANSLLVLRDGVIADRYDKRLLPTYDVFDEDRYFTPGDRAVVVEVAGVRVGLSICEDLWRGEDAGIASRYHERPDPVAEAAKAGAEALLNASASPFVLGKGATQREILKKHARTHGLVVAEVNQLGANDDVIFDGTSSVFVPDATAPGGARLIAAGRPFEADLVVIDLPALGAEAVADPLLGMCEEERLWRALVLGVRDYARKSGFSGCVLGLSGGIDSALTACIGAAALGGANTLCIGMPSRYSSAGSVDDARDLAERIGAPFVMAPIGAMHEAAETSLTDALRAECARLGVDAAPGVAEENIQSRLRGMTVMAFSNKLGLLALTTGNKSEYATGYATLYGDMNGGLAVLIDVLKTRVYTLSRWINANHGACGFSTPPIPESTITKPPSAELKPDQTDQDTLPPYDVLDEIIRRYVEERQHPGRITRETEFDPAIVTKTVRMIDRSEYKRFQAAIGLKVSRCAFGPGRRMPLVNGRRPAPGG
ncbi:MAG: NAD+ synthase [Phycisphaerales bacterium]